MKICFLTHNLKEHNGGGVMSRHIIEGVRDTTPAEVIAIVTEPSGARYEENLLSRGFFTPIRNFWEIRKFIKSADIVHAMDIFPYGVIAYLASLGLRKKFIVTIVGSGSLIALYKSPFSRFYGFILRRADALTAISRFIRDETLKKIPGLSIEVITPGIDLEKFSAPAHKEAGRNLNLPPRFIVSVGSIRWRKGYKYSLRAFAGIAGDFPDLHYVIVGKRFNDVEYTKLRALAKEIGVASRFHILEDVQTNEELTFIYSKAELFILLSQNKGYDVEGFGMVFLEAAAGGLAAVGSANCGISDAVSAGENALLVDSRDTAAAAWAINSILSDNEKKKAMERASLDFVKEFEWRKKVTQYVNLYKRILQKET